MCVCVSGVAAEGLVSVNLSSSCMNDWPPQRPNVEYRQEGEEGWGEEDEGEDVEGERRKEEKERERSEEERRWGHPLCLITARGTKVNLTAITWLITATL